MSVTIKGNKKHADRLRRIAKQTAGEVARALYEGGQKIEIDAEQSIVAGSISGPGHVPSLPGQPPNADTRHLDSNIDTTIVAQNPPTVHVTSHAEYSAALEFGTSRIAERPFMRPATAKNRDYVTEKVKQAVNITVRRG